MTERRPVAVVIAFALGVAACAPEEDAPLAQSGAALYLDHCAACHGRDARGDGPAVVALAKRPPDLTAIAARRDGAFPESEIARWIDGRDELPAHGSREMPVWGRHFGAEATSSIIRESVVRADTAALVEYLKSIQRSGPR